MLEGGLAPLRAAGAARAHFGGSAEQRGETRRCISRKLACPAVRACFRVGPAISRPGRHYRHERNGQRQSAVQLGEPLRGKKSLQRGEVLASYRPHGLIEDRLWDTASASLHLGKDLRVVATFFHRREAQMRIEIVIEQPF